MEMVILVLLLGAVTYRVARFILLDTMIDGVRDRMMEWLDKRSARFLYRKLLELFTCPFCITVWVSGGAALLTRVFVGPFAMPVWVWLASATFALVLWAIIDPDE